MEGPSPVSALAKVCIILWSRSVCSIPEQQEKDGASPHYHTYTALVYQARPSLTLQKMRDGLA